MPTGLYKRSGHAGELIRRGHMRRKALGLPLGPPAIFKVARAECEHCKQPFFFKHYERMVPQRFCNRRCHLAFEREKRRKLPAGPELLYRLYWAENRSTDEIAAMYGMNGSAVRARMRRLGVPRRKVGHSRVKACIVEGCEKPVHKVLNVTNGAWYGRRCMEHWTEYRAEFSRRAYAKLKARLAKSR